MSTEHAKADPDGLKMGWIGPGEAVIPGSDIFKCLQKPAYWFLYATLLAIEIGKRAGIQMEAAVVRLLPQP